jgi:hypothetical protein
MTIGSTTPTTAFSTLTSVVTRRSPRNDPVCTVSEVCTTGDAEPETLVDVPDDA